MTQVSANASPNPSHHSRGEPSVNTTPSLPPARRLVALTLSAAFLALAVALRAPLVVTVVGLIVFGVLHNVLEIRYVAGRFAAVLTGRFLGLLLVLTTAIMACRLTAAMWPRGARIAEVGVGYLILAAGCWIGLRGIWLVVGYLVLAVAAWASFSWPAYHFVMLTHLHNLVPLAFLWEWARAIGSRRARTAFRLTQVLWVVVVPVVILLGAADRWISAAPGVVARFVGNGQQVIATSAPPDASTEVGLRFLVVFAFMQTMHYLVWVGFLPKFAPDAAGAFDARVPWLRGRRAWWVGGIGGAFLAVLFLSDYFAGRALYGVLATYHAYLEFPVLLALVMAPALVGAGRPTDGSR